MTGKSGEAVSPRQAANRLPDIADIGLGAPFGWLSGAWRDLWRAPVQHLTYGLGLAAISAAIGLALLFSGQAGWIMVAIGGFFFIAPMLAMGLYHSGRELEQGRTPKLSDMLFVRTASARDLAYLGLALLLVYFFWGRMAQLIYALSTYRIHDTAREFFHFMTATPEGRSMALTGTFVGGVIAFIAYALIAISAPMLLDRRAEVFAAAVSSFRAVARNPGPMLLWAMLIALLVGLGVASGFFGLIVVFPWIGLASWRAYRQLAPEV